MTPEYWRMYDLNEARADADVPTTKTLVVTGCMR